MKDDHVEQEPERPQLVFLPSQHRRASPALVVVALAIATLAAACTHKGPQSNPKTSSRASYALPSDGWTPGDFAMTAAASGPFHAALTSGSACAWVGESKSAFLWPKGYRVRFNPAQLISPAGAVVATEGVTITVGGGSLPLKLRTPCGSAGEPAFSVEPGPVGTQG